LAGLFQVLGLGLRPSLARFSAKVYYSPAHALPPLPAGVKRCITLYDLIPVKFPQWYDESESFRRILRSIDGKRDRIVAISECTRRDWLAHSSADPSLCEVVTLGVSEDFRPRNLEEQARIRKKYGLNDKPFLLAVGTLEPRKNLENLIRAFLELRRNREYRDLALLVAGARGWKNDSLFRLLQSSGGAESSIQLAGFVPDGDLPALYSACALFVYPSLYEGYGLPVAEALLCGAAVLCGNHSSLPEVAGDAAAYTDVSRPEKLRAALETLLSDAAERKRLKAKARERAGDFSWGKSAAGYLEIFSSLAG
jgi:glycosyltransferase involved in cell wall biosynthesis